MTKPRILAIAIAVAGLVAALAAGSAGGAGRWLLAWIAVSCAGVSVSYLANRPAWLGKRDGRVRVSTWKANHRDQDRGLAGYGCLFANGGRRESARLLSLANLLELVLAVSDCFRIVI